MIGKLFGHQWKESVRSPLWQKQIVINVILGFFILYMFINVLLLGIFFDKILIGIFDDDPVAVFNSGLLYYVLIDLIVRLYFQELPVLSIQPYLHLPIRKSKLIHYVLFKALSSFFNYLPLFILVPFAVKTTIYGYDGGNAFSWFIGILALILANNYFASYLKRLSSYVPSIVLVAIAIIPGLMVLDYLDILSISAFSAVIFHPLITNPFIGLIPVLWLIFTYWLNFRFLLNHAYIEDLDSRRRVRVAASSDMPWLRPLGEAGQLIGLQIRLILRHKRPKSVLYMSVMFILYPLIFYTNERYMDSGAMMLFVGVFATGMFMLNYGQFLLSWEGGYFDSILVNHISYYEYFRSKYIMFVSSCLIAYILTLPYAYFGMKVILFQTAMLFWNLGVSSFIVLYFATIDPKKIDLSKSSAFNWQGVSAAQFLLMVPILILPMVLYFPFRYLGFEPLVGLGVIAGIGLINILLHKYWLGKLALRLQNRKYKIAESFRDQ